jgi:hypothetical protein
MKKTLLVLMVVAVCLMIVSVAWAGSEKVYVCHNTSSETNEWVLINISENAFLAHIDHGDAAPGDDVPGLPGYSFDDSCNPELTSLAMAGCFDFIDIGSNGHVETDGSVIQNVMGDPLFSNDVCTVVFSTYGNQWVVWAADLATADALCNGGTPEPTNTPNLWLAVGCNPLP